MFMNISVWEFVCLGRNTAGRIAGLILIFALAATGGSGSAAGQRNDVGQPVFAAATVSASPASSSHVAENFAALPLSFEANQGQSSPQVRYISRGNGYTLFLTGDEAILKLRQGDRSSQLGARRRAPHTLQDDSVAMLHMRLAGANPAATIAGLDEQAGKSNYFIGNDPSKWRTNVPNYAKVEYHSAYPGIDLIYYGEQSRLEYDFVVAPGADPGVIAMEIAADSLPARRQSAPLSISANGDLVVSLAGGEVRFHEPIVYQPSVYEPTVYQPAVYQPTTLPEPFGGQPAAKSSNDRIGARWVIKDRNRVGFELAAYDRRKPLVIDPALSFSTYLGGSLDDTAYSIAVDSSSDVYVAGTTDSTDFPTENALQADNAGNEDAFITKFNSTGTALIYSTYLGGSATDFAFALALDSSNNVHVVGTTQSTDFPVTSKAFQTTCASCAAGLPSAFVTELNSTGSALLYSTYLGGSNDSRGYAIALDGDDAAYITGRTSASDFPTTTGALQKTLNGAVNVFVTKLNSSGSALGYSTYLGGSSSDQANAIAIDSSDNAYVAGTTSSTNFPTTVGAFQTKLGGTSNALISKLNSKGTALVYSTYLGGNAADTAWGIRLDATNNAYVVGQTSSTNFPTTTGAFQTACGADCAANDAFAGKLNPAGTALVYSTYLGGSSEQEAFALTLDSSGDAYVTGRTSSTDFPLTKGSFQTAFGGVFDAFVTELNPVGSAPLYSTYFGGNASDAGLAITLDAAKNIYVTGRTYSSNFPTTPLAFAQTCATCSSAGYEDAFVAKFVAGDQVWPLALNFGTQQVGVKSSALSAVLSNSGTTTLGITGFSVGGTNASEFAESNTCGSSLAAGASCKISVTFTPASTGAQTATVSIDDSGSNSPQTVSLSGSGTDNTVTLTPTSLTFASQLVGTSSPAQNAVLSNTGAATVTISGIVASGQFNQTNNCGSTLAAGTSCTISVVFAPTAQGTDKGSVKITDNAEGSPQTLTLAGLATVVSLTPATVGFGDQKVGTTSAAQVVTIANHGATTLTVKKIAVTGTGAAEFAETNTCGTSLAAGATCTANVTFTPKTTGSFTAAISIADNGGASPQSAALTGTGD
jgi:beta-propeller repeat-containing protein/ASPM-SPD-2-Hydin domain-containing protein/HYDIN/CFA65/VesB family protein